MHCSASVSSAVLILFGVIVMATQHGPASPKSRPSIDNLKQMKKGPLLDAALDLLTELTGKSDSSGDTREDALAVLIDIRTEMRLMREDINTYKRVTDKKISDLEEKNDYLTGAMMQHQRFLESLDARQRHGNLILTGLSEHSPLVDGHISVDDDSGKMDLILEKIGAPDVIIESVQRLGKPPTGTSGVGEPRSRALKVKLSRAMDQKQVLDKAKKLKEAGDTFAKIFIKRDMHPQVRREMNRIRQAEKAEKDKAENTGRTVFYDPDLRTLSVDNVIIDRFKPVFFQ